MADYGILRRHNNQDLDSLKKPTYVSYASTTGAPPIHHDYSRDYSRFNDPFQHGTTTGAPPIHYDYSRFNDYVQPTGGHPIQYDTGSPPIPYDYSSREYSRFNEPTLQGAPAIHRYFPTSDNRYMPWVERQMRTLDKYVCCI